ncbi:unnamed protein product [Protopolystoma xenopodis]|uniref:Uncharacterized protein n=1 Tax=Protopolystoma xenopodis TaxID=117903 RepID=A0A3S5A796_9PLAT|nr:unnamed protein product [Protopolystoma xenopodis]
MSVRLLPVSRAPIVVAVGLPLNALSASICLILSLTSHLSVFACRSPVNPSIHGRVQVCLRLRLRLRLSSLSLPSAVLPLLHSLHHNETTPASIPMPLMIDLSIV